jgi:hypothetical protein
MKVSRIAENLIEGMPSSYLISYAGKKWKPCISHVCKMTIYTIPTRTAPLSLANVTHSSISANSLANQSVHQVSDIPELFREIMRLERGDRLRLFENLFMLGFDLDELDLLHQQLAAEQFRRGNRTSAVLAVLEHEEETNISDAKESDTWALSPAKDYRTETSSQLYIYLRQRQRNSKRHFLGGLFRMDADYEYQYELQDSGKMVFKGVNTFKLRHKKKSNTEKVVQLISLEPPKFNLSDTANFKAVQIPLRVQFFNPHTFEAIRVNTLDFPFCFSDGGELSLADWKAEPLIMS